LKQYNIVFLCLHLQTCFRLSYDSTFSLVLPSFCFNSKQWFSIYCENSLVAMNSLNFCCLGKFTLPSLLKSSVSECHLRGWHYFFIRHFHNIIPLPSGLQGFCFEHTASLMVIFWYVRDLFSLISLIILSLCLTFGNFVLISFSVAFLFGFINLNLHFYFHSQT
jgi:hypothetical protein